MARSGEPPQGAIVLRTYRELDQFVEAFAEGLLNLLLIIGRPGVQKSQAVKAAVGRRACWIEGSATAFGLYAQLYDEQFQGGKVECHCEDGVVYTDGTIAFVEDGSLTTSR